MIGTGLLLYPTLSNYYNTFHQSKAITQYAEITKELSAEEIEALTKDAKEYNKALITDNTRWKMTDEERKVYNNILDISGTGVMGYIEIPKVNISLPIYHGTSDGVLQIAVGHLEGSSLPVGGPNTHCVLSGHRGLPSADLFTHLDRLNLHDVFTINVLDKVLVYEVDQIKIVVPGDTQYLQIEDGKDYCTLLTCTPYGINTHRLLVRGKRVAASEDGKDLYVYPDAYKMDAKTVAVIMAIPLTILILIGMAVHTIRKRRRNKEISKIIEENELKKETENN